MKLETFFSETDIHEIYTTTIKYSILKYQTFPKAWQEQFAERYKKANQFIMERNIDPSYLDSNDLKELKDRLTEYEIIYNTNIELNRETIKQVSSDITRLIIYTINSEPTEISRVSYLFDFLTNYMNYSEDYNKYCLEVPPIDGFNFEFKNNIPVEPTLNGALVMRQGLCEEISNILQHLGRLLNLRITKINCNYKNSLHSLNMITLSDGNTYLMDATRLIRKDKTKEECFLVSASDLNKDNYYEFKDTLPLTTTYKDSIPNYSSQATELINKVNQISPQIEDLNNHTKINLR